LTNLKFKLRGPIAPKNKIVVIEIDDSSLGAIGRWPWHRDMTAYLIEKTFAAGAKVVGLDITFSESDKRISDELAEKLKGKKVEQILAEAETDPVLQQTISKHSDRLVLGWMSLSCQPAYSTAEDCPVLHPEALAGHPQGFSKFAYEKVETPKIWDPAKTPILSVVTFIANIPEFNEVAKHSGALNVAPDLDGYVRKTSLLLLANGLPYPTLPLEMAKIGLNEKLGISFDDLNRVKSLRFENSHRDIPTSPIGAMSINFRGPSRTFPYISALEVMGESDEITVHYNQTEEKRSKNEFLNDAYVFIGLSALGVFDMRAFPFDSNTPGVEGHANILDNLLSVLS
jgi:adenylate cyclase